MKNGVDKRGMIWYSNKAVGAVSTAPQSEMKKTLDSGHKMWLPKMVAAEIAEAGFKNF